MLKNVLAKGVNKLYWVTKDMEIIEAEKKLLGRSATM